MREKILNGFFSAFSAVMWVFTFSVLIFGATLIIAAPDKDPDVTVNSAVITPIPAGDAALSEHGKSGENWYRIEVDARFTADRFSPWTLEADALSVRGREGFVVLPEGGLDFSRAEPQNAVLRVYLRWNGSPEELPDRLSDVTLALCETHTRFGFMRFSLRDNALTFSL